MEENIKTPPHSAEAERGVLGAILLDAQSGDDLRVLDLCLTHGIEPESFYDPRYRLLFETLLEMSKATMPVDALTLNNRLRETGRFDAVGGALAVEALVDSTPTSAHAEYYIDILRQMHVLRKLIATAQETERKCFSGDGRNADVILGDASRQTLLDSEGIGLPNPGWYDCFVTYMGANRMIYPSTSKQSVIVTEINSYWTNAFQWARRVF